MRGASASVGSGRRFGVFGRGGADGKYLSLREKVGRRGVDVACGLLRHVDDL